MKKMLIDEEFVDGLIEVYKEKLLSVSSTETELAHKTIIKILKVIKTNLQPLKDTVIDAFLAGAHYGEGKKDELLSQTTQSLPEYLKDVEL